MSSHRSRRSANGAEEDDNTRQFSIKQRRSQAISLNSFSTKRGHDRAIEEFKKRKETKFRKNATLLREYSKAMKSEGYDVGRGASRKRNFDGVAAEQDKKSHQASDAEKNSNERKKRHKSDPLKVARQKAQYLKEEKVKSQNQKEQQMLEEEKKVQNRKKRARKMMERTRKGQPLMKNVIGDLLGKIRSDCEAEGTGDN